MIETRPISALTRSITRAVIAALVLSSPGLQPYQALAQTVAGSASGAAIPVSVAFPSAGLVAPIYSPSPVMGVQLGLPVTPVTAPVALRTLLVPGKAAAPARTVAAAVAVAAHGLAATLSSRRDEKAAASGVLAQAARAVRAQSTGASEGSVESLGRPFEGSAENGRRDGDATVLAAGGAARGSGLGPQSEGAIDGRLSMPEAKQDYVAAQGKYVARREAPAPTASMGGWAALGLMGAAAAAPFALPAQLLLAAGAVALYFVLRPQGSSRLGLLPDAQAPPGSSVAQAAGRVAIMAGAFLALDWGVKAALVYFGFPIVYHPIVPGRALLMKFAIPISVLSAGYYLTLVHARRGPAQWIDALRKRRPALAAVLKGVLEVLLFPVGLGEKRFVGDLVDRHPAIRRLVKVADVAIAALLAAALGNGVEALVNGRVVDFIPFGHAHANIADFLVFFGAPLLWMLLDFFGQARRAEELRRPARLPTWKYYILPILAIAAFQLSTTAGLAAVPAAAWYGMLFGVLFGLGVLASDAFLGTRIAEFNRSFRPTESIGARVDPVASRLGLGYRFRKRAAAALALTGLGVGAPRLTATDYDALVARFREAPPKLVILDYDDTFLDNSDGKGLVVTPERVELLERLAAAKVRVAFATNRPLDGGAYAMSTMLMEKLPEALRRNFIISTGGGAEVYQYGPNGEKPAAPAKSNPLTEQEFSVLKAVMKAEAARLGVTPLLEDRKGYEYAAIFAPGEKKVHELFPAFEKAIRRAGYDFSVTLKAFDDDPKKKHLEPTVRVSKSSKTMAVKGILELLAAEGARLEPEDVVMMGDDFTVPGYDSAMARALPQGTALAVGKAANAALANVYLLPSEGPEQTVDFLERLIR